MQILSIFHTGGITLMLTLVWALLFSIFMYQALKAHHSGTIIPRTTNTPEQYLKDKIPLLKLWTFRLAIIVTILYVIALFLVCSDYR